MSCSWQIVELQTEMQRLFVDPFVPFVDDDDDDDDDDDGKDH